MHGFRFEEKSNGFYYGINPNTLGQNYKNEPQYIMASGNIYISSNYLEASGYIGHTWSKNADILGKGYYIRFYPDAVSPAYFGNRFYAPSLRFFNSYKNLMHPYLLYYS